MQLAARAMQGGPVLWDWWQKIHAITKQDGRLTSDQDAQLDKLIESRKNDPNWQPDLPAA